MPTSLVTGAAGFLGSHLCDALIAKGHKVIGVDNLETGSLRNVEHLRDPATFRFEQLDIITPYFVEEPVDFVYHLASPASPIDYLRLPLHTLKVGSHGTHHTLGLAKKHRARFLLASTSEVYGDPQVHPQSEDYWGHVNPIGPRGVYDEAKRYAEALTMAYHRQQGVDTSIIRIFNSVLADEQLLFDDGVELQRVTAQELADRLATRALAADYVPAFGPGRGSIMEARGPIGFEYPTDGFTVPSYGGDGRMVQAEPLAFIGHPTDERCFEVTTRYGRSIRVTGHHSIFVEGEDGEPEAKPVVDLEVGERVAVVRRIDVPERDRTSVSMLDVWRRAEGDPWELSVEAPGLGETAWAHRFDLHGLLCAERRNAGPNWRNGAWTKLIRMRRSDRVPLPLMRRLEGMPAEARVRRYHAGRGAGLPLDVPLTDDFLWLLGLWVAEGSWHESATDACITIACEEPVLDRAQAIIERVLAVRVVRASASPARSGSLFVHGQLVLRLMEHLGFADGRKRLPGWILGLPLARLKHVLEGYRVGDGVHSGADVGVRHRFSTVDEELKDDLVVAFQRFGLLPSVGRYTSSFRGKDCDFWRLSMDGVEPWDMMRWDEGVTQRLQARTHGDLVWAPIRAIDEVPASELVYDFSVPGYENFIAGTGVLAKNTYGARMRPNDGRAIPTFLRQALQDRPITVFGDGSQTRSFTYVDDLIAGMIALGESGHHEPVNIGNPNEFTLLELAEQVIAVCASKSEVVYEALPTDDPKVRRPDITKATDLLGWAPTTELREGLQRTLDTSGRDVLTGFAR